MANAPVISPTPDYAAGQGYPSGGAPISVAGVSGSYNSSGAFVPVAAPSASAPATPVAAPATPAPATPAAPTTPASSPGGVENPDDSYLLGEGESAVDFTENPVTPDSLEDQEYAKGIQEAQPSIAAAEDAYNAEIQTETDVGQQEENAAGASLVAAGLGGSTAAAPAIGSAAKLTADQINTLIAQRGQAVQTILDNVRQTAQTNARTDAATAISYMKTLGQNYVALQDFKSAFPDEYNHILASYGGNENALIASGAITAPKILSSYVQGNNYVQTVQDPVTGKVIAQTFALSVTPPVGWTSEKLTNAIVFTDPNNAANSITYTTDPLTGALTVNGTGTGLQTLQAAGVQSGTSGNNPAPSSTTGATAASTTIASILGVQDPTVPLSTVVASSGLGNIASAFIQNEGGTPQGMNNPYNIKFAGQTGATQGKAAPDGGYYANFDTRANADAAFGNMVNKAAGAGTSFQDFVNSYTGSTVGNSDVNPSTGLSTKDYGALAGFTGTSNVPAFNPGTPGSSSNTQAQQLDADAATYLKKYFSTGSFPTASDFGLSTRSGQGSVFSAIQQRATALASALGISLPNSQILQSNLGLISNNNQLLNNLNVQTGTIEKNFGLNLQNMTANNINNAPPAISGIADWLAKQAGNVPVAQYLTQNATIQQEIGNLLAIKNASGTTVADKIAAGDLLPSDLSLAQQKQILQTLFQEAKNQRQTLGQTNAGLYQQTDPLGFDPNNPVNAPGYKQLTVAGFTDAYDGTFTDSNGNTGYTVQGNTVLDANGNPVATLQ